jgi:carbon monoxide dehydrogenase subunit G
MALKLQNEFVVNAPLETTWATLLDIRRVSKCLPGAALEPDEGDGSYRGSMKIKLGPVSIEYRGVARLDEVDEDAHEASFHVQGKETKGHGTASATIHNRLIPQNGSTKVIVDTDVAVTGRPAQFGRGIMQDVAAKLLGEFARRLEDEILAGPGEPAGAPEQAAAAEAPAAQARPRAEPSPPAAPAQLDLGPAVLGPVAVRLAVAGGVILAALLVLALTRRGGKGISIALRW